MQSIIGFRSERAIVTHAADQPAIYLSKQWALRDVPTPAGRPARSDARHLFDLLIGHLGKERKRQNFAGHRFRHRENRRRRIRDRDRRAAGAPEPDSARPSGCPFRCRRARHAIALRRGERHRRDTRGARPARSFGVPTPRSRRAADRTSARTRSPRLGPRLQVLQLHAENGALNAVHPVVEALDRMFVARPLAPAAKQPHGVGVLRVVRHRRAALAIGAQVLPGIEAEAPDVASDPARRPLYSAPCAWHASSMTTRPCRRAISMIGSMSAGWPNRCTGMTAFVRGVIARSSADGSIV